MNTLTSTWILIIVCFTTYFIVSMVYKKLGITNIENGLLATNGLRLLNLKHVLGIIVFGIIFYVISPEFNYLVKEVEIARLNILLPFFVIVFLTANLSKASVQKRLSKQVDISEYSFTNALGYFVIRFVFLLCYEFFFRGILLYKFLEFTSIYLAILYSTILYVLIHIFDSRKEILGAIPFGILLCLFTYFTNSIWYAFFIHLALSAVYEITMFYSLTFKNKIA